MNTKLPFILLSLLCISFKAHAMPITYTFDALGEKSIAGQKLPTIGSTSNDYSITNNTSFVWTDFHLDSQFGGFTLDSYTGPGTGIFSGIISNTLGTDWSQTFDLLALSVNPGDTLNFTVSTFCAGEICGLGTIYTAYPTIDNNVPEPSVLWLLGAGIGLIGLGRRKAKA